MRFKSQIIRDQHRESYLVTFPTDLDSDRVLAWLRSVTGTLPKRKSSRLTVETMVFETWATSSGITHRLMIPSSAAEYIAAQLRTHGRGITVTKDEDRPTVEWNAGVELGMSNPARTLRIVKHSDIAASLLGSIQALQAEEAVMIQWVTTPAPFERPPSKEYHSASAEFRYRDALTGPHEASGDELQDRRQKLTEQNMLAIGRVVAKASSPKRASELVLRVESALSATNSAGNYFKSRGGKPSIGDDANEAASLLPFRFPAQLTLTELAAVIAWPIGQPFVAGLPQGTTRHIYATEDIPTEGRILGDSNYPGHERAVALDYNYAVQHLYIGGKTGTGKTLMMANAFSQDVAAGYGAIVIDASNSQSNETMFNRAMNYIPAERLDEVIVMDIQADRLNPVAFNILEQGNPRVVASQIMELIAHLYSDTSGVWTKQLLYYGLYTLAEREGMTLVDLIPLINPKTREESAWSDELIRSVKDRDLRDFWQRWDNFTATERDRYTQPLLNRIWQLVSRPEARDIIGQSKSSFKVDDVLANNKILLVNLAGLPGDTASILGTLLVNAIWTAAQTMNPEKPNFLYLDEFQVMTKLPLGLDDMLNRARKHGLGVVMGTQYLEDVPAELKNAVINNARSRVIFQTSAQEARIWQSEFGKSLDANDFMRIRQYEAVAQVATMSGITQPVTLKARPPRPATGMARKVREVSRKTYGRTIADVEAERDTRRVADKTPTTKRPSIGIREW